MAIRSETEGNRLAINLCNIIKVLFYCCVFVARWLECVLARSKGVQCKKLTGTTHMSVKIGHNEGQFDLDI